MLPVSAALLAGLDAAVAAAARVDPADAWRRHARVAGMYRWSEVCARTERVYGAVRAAPHPTHRGRIRRYLACGPLSGKVMVLILFLLKLYSAFIEWLHPRKVRRSRGLTFRGDCFHKCTSG